jgi:hypothetical protein
MASTLDDYKVPTTSLQAVNLILEAMGSRTVSSLTSPGSDGETALRRLGEASVETQSEGWPWNTDEAYQIDPSVTGEIVLPRNVLKVAKTYFDGIWDKKLVMRGIKAYDRKNHTFNIGISVKFDLTIALAYEDLPPAARWYVALRAARRAAVGKLVSPTIYQFTKADEDVARLRMEQESSDMEPMSMQDNQHIGWMRRR